MAVLRFPKENLQVNSEPEIREALAPLGVDYERWSLDRVPPDASADEVLGAYADEIEEMKRRGGYVTADVIDVNPGTPNLDAMLARFDKEHTHDEDEVRFILSGRGIFFLHINGRVASVEVGPGDMLRVPRGTTHWFTLCEDRRIRADPLVSGHGWDELPTSTESGVNKGYQPALLGPAYLGRASQQQSRMTAPRPRVYLLDVEGTGCADFAGRASNCCLMRGARRRFLKQNIGFAGKSENDLKTSCRTESGESRRSSPTFGVENEISCTRGLSSVADQSGSPIDCSEVGCREELEGCVLRAAN